MGSETDLRARGEELGSEHYRAEDVGISVDAVYTYLAVSDDLYHHIGIYGHHESEDGVTPEEWSEEKKKYENMRYARNTIEDEWDEIAQTLDGRSSLVSTAAAAIAALNDVVF
jgi:hypothetical protein